MSDTDLQHLFAKFEEAVTGVIHEAAQKTAAEFAKVHAEFAKVHAEIGSLKQDLHELTLSVDSIDRKLDSEIGWRDRADHRISRLEKHTGLPMLDPE